MRSALFFTLVFLSLSVLYSCGKSKNLKVKGPQEKAKNGSRENVKLDPEKDFIEVLSKGKTPESTEFVEKALKDSAQISAKASLENILFHYLTFSISFNENKKKKRSKNKNYSK